jgi:hypothetical protein
MMVKLQLTVDEYRRLDAMNKTVAPGGSVEDLICRWATQELQDERIDSHTLGLVREKVEHFKIDKEEIRRFWRITLVASLVAVMVAVAALVHIVVIAQ